MKYTAIQFRMFALQCRTAAANSDPDNFPVAKRFDLNSKERANALKNAQIFEQLAEKAEKHGGPISAEDYQ